MKMKINTSDKSQIGKPMSQSGKPRESPKIKIKSFFLGSLAVVLTQPSWYGLDQDIQVNNESAELCNNSPSSVLS